MIDAVPHPALTGQTGVVMLGVPFHPVTLEEALDRIEEMIASGRPHYVVTPNLDFVAQARVDAELRRILMEAHLVLCDGTPLLWAAKLLGAPLPQRVAGSDLVPLLLHRAAEKKHRVFFLGASPETGRQALDRLRARYPALTVSHYSPPFCQLHEMDHEDIRQRILQARPHLLFVCFGCPKQEKWIAMHYRRLCVPVVAGVGGTLDFLAGRLKRAPLWMQRSGVEWIYRLAQEPRRLLPRYVRDLWVFGAHLATQPWRLRLANRLSKGALRPRENFSSAWEIIPLPERLDSSTRLHSSAMRQQPISSLPCVLDCSQVRFIDSAGLGLLVRCHNHLRDQGRPLILLCPSPALKRVLALMRLDPFFSSAPDLATARQHLESPGPQRVDPGLVRAAEETTLSTLLQTAPTPEPAPMPLAVRQQLRPS
jgi:N-acetylglucosaminyldiphosphoundecaprenol N-acetyl-beta-D-mannosaminyltransferase